MFSEDDYIQISALQHYVFCPRQCALIHVENIWDDNVWTVRGDLLHEKVDSDTFETRGTVKTVRGLRIHSPVLGIVGRADVVEFHRLKNGKEQAVPVEFKSGKSKEDISDKVQLCAQALCLEYMLGLHIPRGFFFYGRPRRREAVHLDDDLRAQTGEIIASVREIVSKQVVPPAKYMKKCGSCSLERYCQPRSMNAGKLSAYVKDLYQQ